MADLDSISDPFKLCRNWFGVVSRHSGESQNPVSMELRIVWTPIFIGETNATGLSLPLNKGWVSLFGILSLFLHGQRGAGGDFLKNA